MKTIKKIAGYLLLAGLVTAMVLLLRAREAEKNAPPYSEKEWMEYNH